MIQIETHGDADLDDRAPNSNNNNLSLHSISAPSSSDDDPPSKLPNPVKYSLDEMLKPGWFKKMLWQEKFSIAWFVCCIAFCIGLSQGVSYWQNLKWQAWYAMAVLAINFWMLVRFDWLDASFHMMFALCLLIAGTVITSKNALLGFGSTSVAAIPVLTVAAAGLEDSGALSYLSKYILRRPKHHFWAQVRLTIPAAFLSVFIHNTPLVAMLIPVAAEWARGLGIPASKLMIPLAWSIILGGMCSILGTSTNLVVAGLATAQDPTLSFPTFEMIVVGAPVTAIGVAYILAFQHWLLPVRKSPFDDLDDASSRNYLLSLAVSQGSTLDGRSIEDAGLRHLSGVFLSEITRHGETITAPGPDFTLLSGDRLLFAGDVRRVADLLRLGGLEPLEDDGQLLSGFDRILIEAVVSPRSELLSATVAELSFRSKYDAAIVGIFRHGERLHGVKYGEVQLENGDTLLMIAKPSFLKRNHADDFAVINQVGNRPISHDPFRLLMAPIFSVIFIVLSAVPYCDVFTASLCCVFAMYIIGCYTFARMAQSAMMAIYVLVAASFALANALSSTGVAQALGSSFVYLTKWAGDFGVIFGVFLATVTINIALNNDAAAATMVPVAISISKSYDIPVKTLIYAVMFAGSNDFCTPIGYQVNTMVWGPGGYKFLDYTWFGLPLQILLLFVTPALIYGVWGGPDAFSSGATQLINATLPS